MSEEANNKAVQLLETISLRDYFAAKAMHALLGAVASGGHDSVVDIIPAAAYQMADKMILERNK